MNIHIDTVYLKKNEKNMRVAKENNSIEDKWGVTLLHWAG